MSKIALIGAGGVIFTQNMIKDILLSDVLKDSEIVLMDIDAERLNNSKIIIEKLSAQIGVKPIIHATTDLHEAVCNADYVITMFRSGNFALQELEQTIPHKYGVDQVVADTMGPGGVFRGLRTLKDLFEVLDAMETECPGAYMLNYVNPMSLNTIALNCRAQKVKIVGLCHSVPHTAKQLSKYIDLDYKKLDYLVAGVNHQAFFLELKAEGKDMYPKLREAMNDPMIYKEDKVRFELFRHFGYFPTESSGHASEYIPYIRKRQDLIDRFCSIPVNAKKDYSMDVGTSGASIKVCAEFQEKSEKKIQALLDGTEELDISPSDEYAIQIITAIESNITLNANLNVINHGLIPTLPPKCCVEVPCLVNADGVKPQAVENYPEQLAGLNRGMINLQMMGAEGALTSDKRKVFQAIALDPLTAAVCSLDEIQAMTDELFEAFKEEINPDFFK